MQSRSLPFHCFLAVLIVTGCAGVAAAQSATVDEIVAKNLAAKGGVETLRRVTTVRMSGTSKTPAGLVTVTMWTKRPNSMRQEVVADKMKIVTGYDGKTLWIVNPIAGPDAKEVTGPMVDRLRQETADFDSVLLDYKAKGSTVELVPGDPGAPLHLKVTRRSGSVTDIYLDPKTYLETRITNHIAGPGNTADESTVELTNYKKVDGMMVPFTTRALLNGKPQGEMTYDSVQFNLPLGDELFAMPKPGG